MLIKRKLSNHPFYLTGTGGNRESHGDLDGISPGVDTSLEQFPLCEVEGAAAVALPVLNTARLVARLRYSLLSLLLRCEVMNNLFSFSFFFFFNCHYYLIKWIVFI